MQVLSGLSASAPAPPYLLFDLTIWLDLVTEYVLSRRRNLGTQGHPRSLGVRTPSKKRVGAERHLAASRLLVLNDIFVSVPATQCLEVNATQRYE